MKKTVCLCLCLFMLLTLVSCKSNDFSMDMEAQDSENSKNNESNENTVYKYSNLTRIDPFYNGLAAFVIYERNSTLHWGSEGSWSGDYLYGYANLQGEVVIEPTYDCSPNGALPRFEYDYIKTTDKEQNECIIDKTGKVHFKKGENNVSELGSVSEGYFWVETVSEELSGNIYSVKYYSAVDLSVVASFENVRAITDNSTSDIKATLSPQGKGMIIKGDDYSYYDKDIIYINISDYNSEYIPSQASWTVDFEKIDSLSQANYYIYHVSSRHNDVGEIATVILKNSSNVAFYAIVDNRGNVLLQPQKNIVFINDKNFKSEFCMNLCPAKDATSGMWGYIDTAGTWRIKPQYSSATPFSKDGYASVNDKIIINTYGNIVLSPTGYKNELISSLSGKFKYKGGTFDYYMEFTEDGEVEFTESMGSTGSSWITGKYSIKGTSLVISEIGSYKYYPGIEGNGTYPFYMDGKDIVVNGTKWTFCG